MPNSYSANKQKGSRKKLWLLVALVTILLLVAGYFIAKYHSKPPIVRTNNGTATANPNVPGNDRQTPATGNQSASKDADQNSPAPAPSSDVQPATPSGQFVSYHSPNLSGHPGPNTESSVCQTTPGVQCKITFTNGSTVISLPAQKTDANGNTIWDSWTLQSIGLTQGTWTVKAVAINGSKTATATDAAALVVSP